MQTYKIISYDIATGNHTIQDEKGYSHACDLLVSGNFKDLYTDDTAEDFCKSIVGKTIRIGWLQHYLSLGHEIQIVDESKPEPKSELFEQACNIVRTHAKAFYGINLEGGVK